MLTDVFQTPRTTLRWSTLEEWLECAHQLARRSCTTLHHEQARLHVRALVVELVYGCANRETLRQCDELLRHGPNHLRQPHRGQRADAPQTALIVAIKNRIKQIDRAEDLASMGFGHNSRNAGIV